MNLKLTYNEANIILERTHAPSKYCCRPKTYSGYEWANLRSEIHDWVDINIFRNFCIRGAALIDYSSLEKDFSSAYRGDTVFWLEFENDSDALLFKMRWL